MHKINKSPLWQWITATVAFLWAENITTRGHYGETYWNCQTLANEMSPVHNQHVAEVKVECTFQISSYHHICSFNYSVLKAIDWTGWSCFYNRFRSNTSLSVVDHHWSMIVLRVKFKCIYALNFFFLFLALIQTLTNVTNTPSCSENSVVANYQKCNLLFKQFQARVIMV